MFQGVEDLLDRAGMPRALLVVGVDEDEFQDALPRLAMSAFGDLSNRTNLDAAVTALTPLAEARVRWFFSSAPTDSETPPWWWRRRSRSVLEIHP